MRFKQIIENSTTAGSVATVAQPMMTQTRESVDVPGLKPVQQVIKGKAKKQGTYANSISESKVTEDDLSEQDLIVIPGQGRLKRTGFVKHDLDQGEHEGHTLKNSLHTIARAASELDKRLSVQSEFPEWVSEKIGAAKGMMVTVMDYLISSQEMQHDPDTMNEGSQRVDSLVTDALRVMKGPEVSDAVLALKRVLGDRAYNERRGFYSFYVDQIHDMYGQQGVEEGKPGLWANIHAKRERIKHGSGEHMRTPGSKGAPTADALRKSATEGMAEGDMYGDAEVSWEKGGRRAPTGAFRNPNFGNVLQKSVNKHNKAIVKTRQDIGSRVADIGPGGKEYNVNTDAAWDAAKKKVAEGYSKKK